MVNESLYCTVILEALGPHTHIYIHPHPYIIPISRYPIGSNKLDIKTMITFL